LARLIEVAGLGLHLFLEIGRHRALANKPATHLAVGVALAAAEGQKALLFLGRRSLG
jgi:hypothetical protein